MVKLDQQIHALKKSQVQLNQAIDHYIAFLIAAENEPSKAVQINQDNHLNNYNQIYQDLTHQMDQVLKKANDLQRR